jgi:putative ABC transport system permease protein
LIAIDSSDRSPMGVILPKERVQDPCVMGVFAWRNLLTRPIRTFLALVGLSIPVLGVLGLFALSNSLRDLVGDTLGGIEGLIVLSDNALSPVLSNLPESLADDLRKLPHVRSVAPEVWGLAPSIEGRGMIAGMFTGKQTSIFDQPVIAGQDIAAHRGLRSAIFPRALREHGEGRFLRPGDEGQPNIVISRKIAREHPGPDGRPRRVGESLNISGKPFHIVGIYETGSMLLDVVIIMDISTARAVLHRPAGSLSTIYVEGDDPKQNEALIAAIEQAHPGFDARSMGEAQANFSSLMGQIDTFLLMTVSLALLVGIVGIVNTMLMSTTERFAEFGVLRTNGWSQGNILALVTLESAYLGLLAGVAGCLLASTGAMVANRFVSGGIHLGMPPSLWALGIGLSVATGTLGGLYPAWRAARLVPMEAIRLGSR